MDQKLFKKVIEEVRNILVEDAALIDVENITDSLKTLVEILIKVGNFEEVVKIGDIADQIDYGRLQAKILAPVVENLIKLGKFAEAFEAAKKIKDSSERVKALVKIAEGLSERMFQELKSEKMFVEKLEGKIIKKR